LHTPSVNASEPRRGCYTSVPGGHSADLDERADGDERDEAIRHALAGGDFERAAHLIELEIPAPAQRPVVEIGPFCVWVPRALSVARIRSD
jgi:hypothetical protein